MHTELKSSDQAKKNRALKETVMKLSLMYSKVEQDPFLSFALACYTPHRERVTHYEIMFERPPLLLSRLRDQHLAEPLTALFSSHYRYSNPP